MTPKVQKLGLQQGGAVGDFEDGMLTKVSVTGEPAISNEVHDDRVPGTQARNV
jgi:hypothetical protein